MLYSLLRPEFPQRAVMPIDRIAGWSRHRCNALPRLCGVGLIRLGFVIGATFGINTDHEEIVRGGKAAMAGPCRQKHDNTSQENKQASALSAEPDTGVTARDAE